MTMLRARTERLQLRLDESEIAPDRRKQRLPQTFRCAGGAHFPSLFCGCDCVAEIAFAIGGLSALGMLLYRTQSAGAGTQGYGKETSTPCMSETKCGSESLMARACNR